MKPGEEDVYIEWRWNTSGRNIRQGEPPRIAFEELEELTKGHFRVKMFYSGALGSVEEGPDLVGSGLYESHQCSLGNYPSLTVADLPGIPFMAIPDQEKNSSWATWYIDQPLPMKAWKDKNLYPFFVWTMGELYLWTRDLRAKSVADLKGVMCATKGSQAQWVEDVGMVPVIMPISRATEALQRGMVDAAITWPEMGHIVKWHEEKLTQYCLQQTVGGMVSVSAVNLDAWNELPDYMKEIFAKFRRQRFPQICREYVEGRNDPEFEGSYGWEMKQAGVDFYKFAPEEASKYAGAAKGSFEKWIETVVTTTRASRAEVVTLMKSAIAKRNEMSGDTFWYQPE